MITMVMYAKIRRMFFREHLTVSEIQRRTSLSRNTIKKWLKEPDESATKYQRVKADGLLTCSSSLATKGVPSGIPVACSKIFWAKVCIAVSPNW